MTKPKTIKKTSKAKKPAIKSTSKSKKTSKKTQPIKATKYLNFGNFSLLFGGVLLLFGLLILINPLITWVNQKGLAVQSFQDITSQSAPANEIPRIEGKPSTITISSVKISLPIIDGIYYPSSATWSLSLDKAHYAVMTPMPNNQSGNTFIYAHNRKNVFMSLPAIKEGDITTITTENGKKFTYRYRSAITTEPNDTSILGYQGAPILTLQTCTGLWYQNRTLFVFDFVSVEEVKPNA